MVRRSRFLPLLAVILLDASVCQAALRMKWGLENTRSYKEEKRSDGQDLAIKGKRDGKRVRTFAFVQSDEIVTPMLRCFDRHNKAWDEYQRTAGAHSSREDFNRYKAQRDPFCLQNARQQAPVLFFDFVGQSNRQYVLQEIVVKTVAFSEYQGGGFAEKEAWYDIILSHLPGTKSYEVEPRLVFNGNGRATLRFWSDNFYPYVGWMAPMGEYTLQVTFVFSTDAGEERVSTETFKMDV